MLMVTENRFRRLHAPQLLSDVYPVTKCKDGIAIQEQTGRIAT